MTLKRFTIVEADTSGSFNCYALGIAVSANPNDVWCGSTGKPDHSYTFWAKGKHYGTFKMPENLTMGTEFHLGQKGIPDRVKWIVADFDLDNVLILERKKEE